MFPFDLQYELPKPGDPGYFATVRRFDVHTGMDLYCEDGTPVYALEDGLVVSLEKFTGEHADSPWWNNTWALLVEGESGVIVYGEIETHLEVGATLKKYQHIGNVKKVLKKYKGVNPPAMLHIELMDHGCYNTYWWKHNEPCPQGLKDPITLFDTNENSRPTTPD